MTHVSNTYDGMRHTNRYVSSLWCGRLALFEKAAHEATDDGEETMESVKGEEWANMTTV